MCQSRITISGPHCMRFLNVDTGWFFTEQVFSGGSTGHDGLVVQCIGRGHEDKINIRMVHHFSPVVRDERSVVFLAGSFQQVTTTGAKCDDLDVSG